MDSNNLPVTSNSSHWEMVKALWNRPGGTFAKITAVGAVLGIAYGMYTILPMLVAAAANTLVFIGELAAIVVILLVLTSKNFWNWVSLFWLQLNRKIVGFFVKIDPVSILENGIKQLREKLDVVVENVKKLEGVLVGMKRDQEGYKKEFEDKVAKHKAIEKMLADGETTADQRFELNSKVMLINREIARLDTLIKAQQKRIDTSEKYLTVMKKLKVVAKAKVEDSENELHWRKQEYEQALRQQSAMKSIMSIMSGGMSKSLEEELALGYMETTVNDSIAEMNQLLDGTNDLLVNFDLDNMANFDKVDAILANFEKNGFESFDTKQAAMEVPYQQSQSAIGNTPMESVHASDNELEKVPVKSKYFS